MNPPNYSDLNHGILHLWSKFGDSSFNGWWIIAQTNSWFMPTHIHGQTDAGKDNTWRPKLVLSKNDTNWNFFMFHELISAQQGLTRLLISVCSAVTSWQFVSWNLLVDGDSLLSSNHGVIWQACSEYCFSNSGTWMTKAAITVDLPWDLVGMLNY